VCTQVFHKSLFNMQKNSSQLIAEIRVKKVGAELPFVSENPSAFIFDVVGGMLIIMQLSPKHEATMCVCIAAVLSCTAL